MALQYPTSFPAHLETAVEDAIARAELAYGTSDTDPLTRVTRYIVTICVAFNREGREAVRQQLWTRKQMRLEIERFFESVVAETYWHKMHAEVLTRLDAGELDRIDDVSRRICRGLADWVRLDRQFVTARLEHLEECLALEKPHRASTEEGAAEAAAAALSVATPHIATESADAVSATPLQRVEAYQAEVLRETGRPLSKKEFYTAAGYTDRRQFHKWQSGKLTKGRACRSFERVLCEKPHLHRAQKPHLHRLK